ncbi:MAG TPA: hypothetical protein VLQ48_01520 [Chloroflexia bacterium]|nr:hypothetical protein [Chloroflexia bacterium]
MRRISPRVWVVLFFFAWAVVFTFPLILHLGDSVALSTGGDAYLHLWDLWWADKSLVNLHQNPFHTTYLYYPTGVSLYYHSLDILNGVVSIPLQHLLNLTFAFNLLALANLTLNGVVAYWLCHERTGSVGAALVGGALFATAPLLDTSVNLGQLDEMTAWWIPLYVLALWRALDSPGKPWQAGGGRRATVCAGLCLVGASLATWYFSAGLAVFTVLFVPLYLLMKRKHDEQVGQVLLNGALKVAVAAGITALILSPLLWAMIRERLNGATYMIPSLETSVHNSVDLISLLLPARVNIEAFNLHGANVALGWVALALSILGIVRGPRAAWPVAVPLIALALVSLGPHLLFAGNDIPVFMPYDLLNNVPFIGASRQPLRFLATAGICLSVLGAYGVAFLLEKTRNSTLKRAVVPVALLLVAVEFMGIPRPLVSTNINPAYTFIRDQPQAGGVMELPYDVWQAQSSYNQSLHDRPILGGYTSRHFPYPFIEGAPGASQLAVGYPATLSTTDIITPSVGLTGLSSLDYYNVRYVVVHKGDIATGRYGRLVRLLGELYPSGPAYEDDEAQVFVTPVGPAAEGDLPLVGLGKGWHEIEENPTRRWTGNDPGNGNAQVWIGIRPQAAGHYNLTMDAFSYGKPRHLTVVLNGATLLQKEIGLAPESLNIDLGDLATGDYLLELNVQELPDNPPNDRRPLSIGYTQITVERSSK